MAVRAIHRLALSSFFLHFAWAQESGWAPNQVNATMCRWDLPRVGVIRDTAYIDGGYLWWMPGLNDGSYGAVTQDGMPLGLIYELNFSTPFNFSQNISQVLTSISKAPNSGAANNFAPQYYDGALFANDGEFFTYGGLLTESDAFEAPRADSVLGYQKYWYGPAGKQFTTGFIDGKLPSNVTRYVAYGGSVNVPSENKGYYFGGMKQSLSGPIFYPSANTSLNPDTYSNTLISIDMANQQNEVWTNETVPSSIPGRTNSELVWIPVGNKGLLIAIGGVVDPVYAQPASFLNATQLANSQTNSPTFLTTVSLYDIDSHTWYTQDTTGGQNATAWTQGCAVVASAADGSSHNIYYYGGFDGLSLSKPFNDDVWILSVPSFIWMRVAPGRASHARAGHRCVKPYPDQMLVLGGYASASGTSISCLGDGVVQAFNLSSLQWMDGYDPAKWSDYAVPEPIYAMIGGNTSGGAKMLAPSTWSNASIAALFATRYDTTKIKNWYPYTPHPITTPNATGTTDTVSSPSTSSVPAWLAPVLGTVLGLVFLSVLIIAFLLWRRRRLLRSNRASGSATSEINRNRIMSWVKGADLKSPTVTSSSPSRFGDDSDALSPGAASSEGDIGAGPLAVEAAGEMVHELADTSQIQELSATGTGMAYLPTGAAGLHASPSAASSVSRATLSPAETGTAMWSPSTPRPDSPTEGVGVEAANEVAPSSREEEMRGQSAGVTPVSPPTPGVRAEVRDYVVVAAGTGVSPLSPPTPGVCVGVGVGVGPSAVGEGGSESGGGSPRKRRASVFGEILD